VRGGIVDTFTVCLSGAERVGCHLWGLWFSFAKHCGRIKSGEERDREREREEFVLFVIVGCRASVSWERKLGDSEEETDYRVRQEGSSLSL
jgi:hypothetical protein